MTTNTVDSSGIEYKTISLPITPAVTPAEAEAIEAFSSQFPRDEIVVDASGRELRVHLRKLDVGRADRIAQDLARSPSNGDLQRDLLGQIMDAVQGIRSFGLDGSKRLYVGYNSERKVKDRASKEIRRGRHFYAKDAKHPRSVNDPPPELTDQIVVGDSEEVLARLPDNCADLIFTSPPYNFGLEYSELPDDHAWEAYFDKLFRIFDQCIRVLKIGGRIAVNVQPLFSDYIPSHHIISNFFIDRRMIWKGEILWEKNNYNCKYTAWGSWKSPSSPYLKYTWEFIEVFCKGDLRARGNGEDADITADEFKSWVNARWSIAPERNMQTWGHPAMFPEELADRVLKLFSFQGAFVVDPFAGVGTTALSAKKTGRHFLGIDVSQDYCRTAVRRLNEILV